MKGEDAVNHVAKLLNKAYSPGSTEAQIVAAFCAIAVGNRPIVEQPLINLFCERIRGGNVPLLAELLKQKGSTSIPFHEGLTRLLWHKVKGAIKTGDWQFFRDLADAGEAQNRDPKGSDPVAVWLLKHELQGGPRATRMEYYQQMVKENVVSETDAQLRKVYRTCDELKISYKRDKPGPKGPYR